MYDTGPKNIDNLLREGYATNVSSYLGRGWEIFQQNVGGFVGFVIIIFLINVAFTLAGGVLDPAASNPSSEQTPSGISALLSAINSVISIPLNAGFYIVALKLVKRRATTFSDFFRGFNYFIPLLLASIVTGIFIVLGFLLLLIPGIYLAVAYTFTSPLIIERKMDFWQAMETSRKVVTKQWFSFLWLGILVFFINVAGALACGLGLLVTVPLTYCTYVAAYENIFGLQLSSED
ncbi:MAG: hypothetical protein Kow00121_44950 [Elainellaceae cyanobacterium]